jgi:hypothetical protein
MGLIKRAAKQVADKAEDVVLGKSEKQIQSVEEGRKNTHGGLGQGGAKGAFQWLAWVAALPFVPILERLPRSREDWRAARSWAADKVEDLVSAVLIVGAVLVAAGLVVGAMWVSPGWMRLLELVALATGWEVAVRLRRASRQIAEIERDELEPSYAGWSS